MSLYFISATDTNVGKSVITLSMALQAAALGKKVAIYKPIESGQEGQLDSNFFKQYFSDVYVDYSFKDPVAPYIAAGLAGVSVDVNVIMQRVLTLQQSYDVVLIEGAGGLMVPIAENVLVVDLIVKLNCPVILIAKNALGTINHTLLSCHLLQKLDIKLLGVIFNQLSANADLASFSNLMMFEKFAQAKLLGVFPYLSNINEASLKAQSPLPPNFWGE